MKLIWRPQAEAELLAIVDYVSAENPLAAARLYERIVASAKQLLQFPFGFRASVEPGVRELVVRKTPYILFYTTEGDEIVILSIIHASRDIPRGG